MDVTGSVGLLGNGGQIADEIRERIRFELGVTASVGVSFSKITAKLASEMKKPDATTLLPEEGFPVKAWPLQSYERQTKLLEPACTTQGIFRAAFRLFKRHHNIEEHPVRSLSVRGCGLRIRTDTQLSLFPDAARSHREEMLEDALDGLRRRYGHFSFQRGIMLTDPQLSDLDAKSDHVIHPTGFLKS